MLHRLASFLVVIASATTLLDALAFQPAAAQNSSNPHQPYDPDPATIALYHLDDGSASIAHDSSGNALDGVIQGATWSISGRFGQALSFDGDDYVSLPGAAAFDTDDATFEAWVLLGVFNPNPEIVIIDKLQDGGNSGGRRLYISSNRRVIALAKCQLCGGGAAAISSSLIPINEWVHVAAIFDETNGRIKVVINGVIEGDSETLEEGMSQDWPLTLGRSRDQNQSFFTGIMDEVRISSIAREFAGQVGVPTVPTTWGRLKALWR